MPSSTATAAHLLWMTAIIGACGSSKPEPVDTLFEGDSDIEGWPTDAYPSSANVGIGGAQCQDVLDTIHDMLAIYQPKQVVLVCGENDLWDQGPQRTFDDFSAVVSRIHQAGATVYYMGTKPEPATASLHADYRAYDARVRQHALELASNDSTPLVMIDVYSGFEALGNPDRLYQRDQLHLSRDGYELWDQWLVAAFADEGCIVWNDGNCESPALP